MICAKYKLSYLNSISAFGAFVICTMVFIIELISPLLVDVANTRLVKHVNLRVYFSTVYVFLFFFDCRFHNI